MLSPVPCWHFSTMTRKSLPSWPQCWAPHTTVETVTMFQQSHQTKFLRSRKKREPKTEGTAEPRVLAELWAASYCFADFRKTKGALPSTRTPRDGCRDLLDREWSYCASGSICRRPQRAERPVGSLQVQGHGGQ